MSFSITASILGWSFAPTDDAGRVSTSLPVAPLSPDRLNLDFIPSVLRRRCSHFSKVTLAVANAAMSGAPASTRPQTVFASTHGESSITRDLLRELASNQQLSPMGFSLSVHNAASGLYSIATGNTAPSTAIAAGDDTFFMGLVESLLGLRFGGAETALLVCSDDLIPGEFLRDGVEQVSPCAFAMLLSTSPQQTGALLTLERSLQDAPGQGEESSAPHAARVARWMLAGGEDLRVVTKGAQWNLSISGSAENLFKSAYR